MYALKTTLVAAALPFLVHGAKRNTPSEFQLYAYGDGIGGLPIFNADGYAFFGDPKLSNSSDAAEVQFTASSDTWIGAPNTTSTTGPAPTWNNVSLFIPSTDSPDARVGFQDSTTTNASHITSGFTFYGSTAMFVGADGELETLWFGLPVGEAGVHALYWNSTHESRVPLTLKNTPPSNPASRR